ncbi:hypothetical protein [Reyranella sp.]|jgi:hypothetical protein|uniref:hypothetical protein n=1 Tax=Reyranella sp. TaxID=1929291 RepID=UPI000BCD2676|nr:hypothetical protein [Reyranella sp.]OYY41663.1 MAG: hypothetical protein B7Y57_13495 [Rhodospirillales bacterium 35-66-84]OYZ93731.1 MAG: hypothetical protein B7Y08_16170 [Rhodospirillales bacterium 24-66-33]OZB24803.1 MAG: hypothetical protein B7X63_14330 [Rhodospirillales bacterium 39-66-50]HQS15670.1 hypothetical protein [Reyranella sp.]HQT12936.1 hypothetical protein [Reyranella sp.]
MPIAPVFLPETLQRLYGIAPADTTMLVLMRHRALRVIAIADLIALPFLGFPLGRPSLFEKYCN